MHLEELMDEIDDLRPDGEEAAHTLNLLQIKLGQVAEGLMNIETLRDQAEEEDVEFPERKVQGVKRDMFAGIVAAAFEFASEHDIDVERAMDDRIAQMKEMRKRSELTEKLREAGFSEEGGPVDTELDPDDDRAFL